MPRYIFDFLRLQTTMKAGEKKRENDIMDHLFTFSGPIFFTNQKKLQKEKDIKDQLFKSIKENYIMDHLSISLWSLLLCFE